MRSCGAKEERASAATYREGETATWTGAADGAAVDEYDGAIGERSLRRSTTAMAQSSAGVAVATSDEERRSARRRWERPQWPPGRCWRLTGEQRAGRRRVTAQ